MSAPMAKIARRFFSAEPIMHYNIPASMAKAYQGKEIIARAHDSSEFPKYLSETDMEKVAYLQLLSLNADTDCLARWGEGIPLDLIMAEPEKEFSQLYRFAALLKKHPVRVSVPPAPGFGAAVRVAASLNFAVRITGGQPAPELNGEMTDILNFYLRHPTVTQPVEYFQSVLLGFLHAKPFFLPALLEEDPGFFCYITDQGEKAISERFAARGITGETASEDCIRNLVEESAECLDCEFLPHCRGCYKWPQKDYSCEGVKRIFQTLKRAARELKEDYAASLEGQRGNNT